MQLHMTLTSLHLTGEITVVCRCGWRKTLPCGSFLDEAVKVGDSHLATANAVTV